MMAPILESTHLRCLGRDLVTPFRLHLSWEGRAEELLCSSLLRVLPGKRLVCLASWKETEVVAKIFLSPRRAERHCARELRGVNALEQAGINTPHLVFRSMLPTANVPVLGFRKIARARDVAEEWDQMESEEDQRALFNRLLSLIADEHEAGLKHDDVHRRNFLLAEDTLYALDGDSVDTRQMGRPLPMRESLKNLGFFLAQLYPKYGDFMPEAFGEYSRKRGWDGNGLLWDRFMQEMLRQKEGREKYSLAKIYRDCSDFVCRRSWERFMVCERSFYSKAMEEVLDDLDGFVEGGEVLKRGNTATVSRISVEGKEFVVKRYNIKSAWHRLRRCIRPTRAWISWRNSHRLLFWGICTPRPIAMVEERLGPFRSRGYFIAEYKEGVSVHHLLRSGKEDQLDHKALADNLKELFKKFDNARIGHGDFKTTNFLVHGGKLYVLDLDVLHRYRSRLAFRRAFKKDLLRMLRDFSGTIELEGMVRNTLERLKAKDTGIIKGIEQPRS